MTDLPAERPRTTVPARPADLEYTEEQLVARRRNRKLMIGVFVPSVVILVLALVASGIAESNQPSGPAQVAPPGYKTANDGYFSYVVPKNWNVNGIYSDNTGDIDRSGPTGWAGEHIGFRNDAPVLGEPQPAALQAFGMPHPTPYQLSDGHQITVHGASVAFEYQLTRPGGFTATAVDAYKYAAGVEIWLVVAAPADVTATVLDRLRA